MYELRFHGRGGQGAVLAAKILAKALTEEGRVAKAIPSFGFERRGAPVSAFLRFDDKPIRQTTNIYHPNCIVCLDPTLPRAVDIFEGMTPGGTWVQATKKQLDQLAVPDSVMVVGLCDAVGLALDIFGGFITNTIMLGALAQTTGIVSVDALNVGMKSVAFRDAVLEKNVEAVRRGYEATRVCRTAGKEMP
ncbi:MAG TPA: 2-oxoacid:acceptor oxidoreductase family protein [Deferrisomatales bacterium]|nr:2-oxoacid:acceptor oxidoreductase family protein [Deferrisomatales bacterium]